MAINTVVMSTDSYTTRRDSPGRIEQQEELVDQELQGMSIRLSELAIRTTAANVYDRINPRKARKVDSETINDLEEIINELLEEKQELVRISSALSDRLARHGCRTTRLSTSPAPFSPSSQNWP